MPSDKECINTSIKTLFCYINGIWVKHLYNAGSIDTEKRPFGAEVVALLAESWLTIPELQVCNTFFGNFKVIFTVSYSNDENKENKEKRPITFQPTNTEKFGLTNLIKPAIECIL